MTRSFEPHLLRKTPPVLVLTPRDKAILGDLVRHRVVSSPWLARAHFRGSQAACWERLRRLAAAGYAEKVETVPGEPKAYRVTKQGKAALGLSAAGRPPKAARPSQLFHTMAIADVAAHLLAQLRGGEWRTERELRDGAGGGWLPKGCYPDGAVELRQGDAVHRLAVEVELSRKERHRYAPKLARYRQALNSGGLAQVRWYVATPTDAQWLRREALLPAGFPKSDGRMVIALLPEHGRYGR
jgi:hypothetical protein